MANEKTEQEKAADKLAAEKPQAPAAASSAPELKVGESSGNLTRDSIIEFQRGKFMEQGKSEDEAQRLAVKRGYEMIKE